MCYYRQISGMLREIHYFNGRKRHQICRISVGRYGELRRCVNLKYIVFQLPLLETKIITSKAMQYRQDIVTRMSITRVELITISIFIYLFIYYVAMWSICDHSAADFLRFRKFTTQICESCGATYRRKYETFSALSRTPSPLTDGGKSTGCKEKFGVNDRRAVSQQ